MSAILGTVNAPRDPRGQSKILVALAAAALGLVAGRFLIGVAAMLGNAIAVALGFVGP